MPFRFRRSFGPKGMKVNLSKRGISTTMGMRGAHVTTGSHGISMSAGIPGSGLSYTKRLSTSSHAGRSAASEAVSQIDQAINAQSSLLMYSVIGSIIFFLMAIFSAVFEMSFGCISVWVVIGLVLALVAVGAYGRGGQLKDQRTAAEVALEEEVAAAQVEQERHDSLARSLDQVELRDFATTVLALTGVHEAVGENIHQFDESTVYMRAMEDQKVSLAIFVIKQVDPIGVASVRVLYKAAMDDRCPDIYIFASAEFTRQAAEFAHEKGLHLFPRERVIQLAMEDRLHW